MKLFFGEFKPDYSKYHFPYQVWLLRENGDSVEQIYSSGFLPIRSNPGVYYLARSVRVNLALFEPSSENRRILKKTENIKAKLVPLSEFNYTPQIQKLCKDYSENRFGSGVLPAAAVRSIFTSGTYSHVFVFEDMEKQKEVGFAVCYLSDGLLQYAHSFYDLAYFSNSLGARMMLEAVSWAKDNGKKFAYLGTCYEDKALYKTEFKGIEFFNGFIWNNNLEELKALIKRDTDQYLFRDKEYLESFHEGDLHKLLSNNGIRVNF
jgi:arginyl-tRNA--protein-N-Asp/Glu arginylyltransferase